MGEHWIFQEEHTAFRKVVRNWLAKEISPESDSWEKAGEFHAGVFKKFGDMGLLGLKFPEEYGGQGEDLIAAAIFLEEMGAAALGSLVGSVGAHSEVSLPPIFKFGAEDQKQKYLAPGIQRGKDRGAGCHGAQCGIRCGGDTDCCPPDKRRLCAERE